VEERVGVEAVYCVSRRKVSQFCLFTWMSPHAIMSVNCLFRRQSCSYLRNAISLSLPDCILLTKH
jgi:hypothetical protein